MATNAGRVNRRAVPVKGGVPLTGGWRGASRRGRWHKSLQYAGQWGSSLDAYDGTPKCLSSSACKHRLRFIANSAPLFWLWHSPHTTRRQQADSHPPEE